MLMSRQENLPTSYPYPLFLPRRRGPQTLHMLLKMKLSILYTMPPIGTIRFSVYHGV